MCLRALGRRRRLDGMADDDGVCMNIKHIVFTCTGAAFKMMVAGWFIWVRQRRRRCQRRDTIVFHFRCFLRTIQQTDDLFVLCIWWWCGNITARVYLFYTVDVRV